MNSGFKYEVEPVATGVQGTTAPDQRVTGTTVLPVCPGTGPTCPNACSCAAYAGKCEPADGVEGRKP